MQHANPGRLTAEHVRPLREVEADCIEAVLERNHGNGTLTARQFEIAPATLFRKLKAYADGHVKRPGAARSCRCGLTDPAGRCDADHFTLSPTTDRTGSRSCAFPWVPRIDIFIGIVGRG